MMCRPMACRALCGVLPSTPATAQTSFQLVLMARTLAQQPQLLLLDEPTSNLDLKHQLSLMALVRGEVANGLAAVAVLHDLSLAARFAARARGASPTSSSHRGWRSP